MNKGVIRVQQVTSILRNIVKNGIEITSIEPHQTIKFLSDLCNFINKDAFFSASVGSGKLTIESIFFDPILSVDFEGSNLQFIPVTDDGWIDAVFVILKFIHMESEEERERAIKRRRQKKENDKQFDWL